MRKKMNPNLYTTYKSYTPHTKMNWKWISEQNHKEKLTQVFELNIDFLNVILNAWSIEKYKLDIKTLKLFIEI